jgi:hypothetical protein
MLNRVQQLHHLIILYLLINMLFVVSFPQVFGQIFTVTYDF